MTEYVGGRCPKDQSALTERAGNLGEDICPRCQGRFLNTEITHQLFCQSLALREEHLHALAKEGFQKWPCPACGRKMTSTWARGLEVELCAGCGGSFLDAGELSRLGDGVFAETQVTPGADDRKSHGLRMHVDVGVFCTRCDGEIEIQNVNWLIEGRPWCAACAAPFVGLASRLLAPIRFLGAHFFDIFSDLPLARRWRGASANHLAPRLVDTMRVSPDDANELFGPFFELLPRRHSSRTEPMA